MTDIAVVLQNDSECQTLPEITQFQKWVDSAIAVSQNKPENSVEDIVITIVNQAKSAELNAEYRNKTGPTNVLAFTYDPVPGFEADSLGDLVICADIVLSEAKQQGTPTVAHWAHLTIHGTLHLLGYDHIDSSDAIVMESLEIKALQTLGFSNPYDENESNHV